MFAIVVMDKQGRLASWGNPNGYLTESAARDATEGCYDPCVIGEGNTLSDAKRNAKYKFTQRGGFSEAEMAHRNVRSTR